MIPEIVATAPFGARNRHPPPPPPPDNYGRFRLQNPRSGLIFVFLCALLVLGGCGGGGKTADVEPEPSKPAPGISVSKTPPVFIKKDESITGSEDSLFPTLGTTIYRSLAPGSASSALSDGFRVNSIRRLYDNEPADDDKYVISYTLDGARDEVTIPESACNIGNADWCSVTVGGREFHFWSTASGVTPYDPFETGEFDYFSSAVLSMWPDQHRNYRSWFVAGTRTVTETLADMGHATWQGHFRARSWKTANSSVDQRQRHYGDMRLVANFDLGQLHGRIYGMEGTTPGEFNDWQDWPTSGFTLTDGKISDGQFTATLTGVDSNPDTPFDESVRGFMGRIFGEFYGPNAEEIGGTVAATRDADSTDNDRVLHGFFGGRKVGERISDAEAFVTGVDQDFGSSTTAMANIPSAAMEPTKDGFRLTLNNADGTTTTLELGEDDFGSDVRYPTSYYTGDGAGAYVGWLWSETGSFTGPTEFAHLDVNGWAVSSNSGGADEEAVGYVVYGTRTADMPTTGTATYSGMMRARVMPSDDAVYNSNAKTIHYRGALDLTANFATAAVAGRVTNLESSPGYDGDFNNAAGGISFNAAVIGSGLSASDLSGTGVLAGYQGGSAKGAFYGAGAAEVGGVFEAADSTNNRLLNGVFAGKKQ